MIGNWKGMLIKVKEMRANYQRNSNIMSQYERETIAEEIKRATEQAYKPVYYGVVGEWKAAVTKAQNAYAGIDTAKAAEINRWDISKLNAELANAQTLVNLATSQQSDPLRGTSNTKRLGAILAEAKASGDLHKQRAVYEVIQAMDAGKLDDKQSAAIFIGQARRDLEAMRTTPEMTQAVQNVNSALAELEVKKREVIDASQSLGEGDPSNMFGGGFGFSQALKMVQVKNGELKFYNEDDPEVTGVDWSKAMVKEAA